MTPPSPCWADDQSRNQPHLFRSSAAGCDYSRSCLRPSLAYCCCCAAPSFGPVAERSLHSSGRALGWRRLAKRRFRSSCRASKGVRRNCRVPPLGAAIANWSAECWMGCGRHLFQLRLLLVRPSDGAVRRRLLGRQPQADCRYMAKVHSVPW